MKTKFLAVLIFFSFNQLTYSQNTTSKKLTFKATKTAFPYSYECENWNKKFKPDSHSLGYDLIDMKIDTADLLDIIKHAISPKYYQQLNNERWVVVTKLTGYGEIVSLSFKFKNNLNIDINELTNLAEQIKKKVRWKLYFNKEVDDLFYLELSFPGPKL